MKRKGKVLSLGKAFEQNGDLRRALRCADGTRSTEEAREIRDRIKILRTAGLFEEAGLEKAAAELLLSNGLMDEAKEFAGRVAKRSTNTSDYACALVHAKNSDLDLAAPFLGNLSKNSGPRGQCLAGLVAAEVDEQKAEYAADILSEKPRKEEPGQKPDGDPKLFFSMSSGVESAAKSMISTTLWNRDDSAERHFCALLYQKIGKTEEAERCLKFLEEKKGRYYLYALMALGKDWKDEETGDLFRGGQAIRIIAERDVRTLIKHLDKYWYEREPEERSGAYAEIIEEIELFALGIDRQLNFRALERLTVRFNVTREELAEKERIKIARIERLISMGDFRSARLAHRLIGKVNRRRLDDTEKEKFPGYRRACADIAYQEKDDKEAQLFAAEEYRGLNKVSKALECAERLLVLGEGKEARRLFETLKLDSSTAKKVAERLEQEWPLISSGLFRNVGDTDAFRRAADLVLKSGSMEDVEALGWNLSRHQEEKQALLMMRILERLRSFGEEGEKKATGICMEMGIKPFFVAS